MTHFQFELTVKTRGSGLYEFTEEVSAFITSCAISTGLITVFCRHTSASLIIQENADSDVQADLKEFFARLVPEGMAWLRHTAEGADDMPAHIKAALTRESLVIPISGGAMALGTWQGIYLFEHRTRPHARRILLHALGA